MLKLNAPSSLVRMPQHFQSKGARPCLADKTLVWSHSCCTAIAGFAVRHLLTKGSVERLCPVLNKYYTVGKFGSQIPPEWAQVPKSRVYSQNGYYHSQYRKSYIPHVLVPWTLRACIGLCHARPCPVSWLIYILGGTMDPIWAPPEIVPDRPLCYVTRNPGLWYLKSCRIPIIDSSSP